jgi:hypothetical protein
MAANEIPDPDIGDDKNWLASGGGGRILVHYLAAARPSGIGSGIAAQALTCGGQTCPAAIFTVS